VRQSLLFDVHTAYWDLVAAIEQEGVAQATLELGRQQLEQNQRRLAAGVGTEVEVLQAEANVALRVEERLLAEVNERSAQDKLKEILFPGTDKVSWDTRVAPVTALPESTPPTVPPWDQALGIALENRAELRQLRIEIEASEVRLSRTKSERMFDLDLQLDSTSRGFDGDSSKAFESATGFEFPANSAALVLSVPIGNRTAKNAERAARARGRIARLQYSQAESQIVGEVRTAVRQIVYSSEAVNATVKSLELARRQLTAEEARYREGLSTNFQVLEFQKQLAEALSAEKKARVAYAKAIAGLARAEGVLGEKEIR
jgi:outer membrane protein TolC